jgi:hypothetical protein
LKPIIVSEKHLLSFSSSSFYHLESQPCDMCPCPCFFFLFLFLFFTSGPNMLSKLHPRWCSGSRCTESKVSRHNPDQSFNLFWDWPYQEPSGPYRQASPLRLYRTLRLPTYLVR